MPKKRISRRKPDRCFTRNAKSLDTAFFFSYNKRESGCGSIRNTKQKAQHLPKVLPFPAKGRHRSRTSPVQYTSYCSEPTTSPKRSRLYHSQAHFGNTITVRSDPQCRAGTPAQPKLLPHPARSLIKKKGRRPVCRRWLSYV